MKVVWVAFALAAVISAQSPDALSNQAQQLAQSGKLVEAERLWKQAIEAQPNLFPALFNLGYMKYSSGRPTEANQIIFDLREL